MTKLYKSAQGRVVDMGALMLQNEKVRAVGNMKVNARGDTIDNRNRIVASRNKQVTKNLNKGIEKNIIAKATKPAVKPVEQPPVPDKATTKTSTNDKGLAGALARANQPKE